MKKYTLEEKEGYWLVRNEGGVVLGVSDPGFIIEVDGYAFKDLNHNGILDKYEDWRLPIAERIEDLLKQMSIEDIGGLMLYSIQQTVALNDPFAIFKHYGSADESQTKNPWELSTELIRLLSEEKMHHITLAMAESAEASARWNNNLQAFAEARDLGIPVSISSDPRHTPAVKNTEFTMGASDYLSTWPENLGMAATFSPELVREYGRIAAKEYRSLGITTGLSPQVDLATEPRWNRVIGTFGESPLLATDLARAYIDGIQTSEGDAEIKDGWGTESVNAMVKHWPGGGTCEAGRDAHFIFGQYAVYPGGNFEEQLKPFVEGAFDLEGPTRQAAAVMPYYSISYGQDQLFQENVGNSYSRYIINELLRKKYKYDGVVCTDWGITSDAGKAVDTVFTGKCWGAEALSIEERHYKVIMAGVDQFGGNNAVAPVVAAYKLGVERIGEAKMKERMDQSARRLLRNLFQVGLFENAYVNLADTKQLAGCAAFVSKGYEAQQQSVVLLKNKNSLLPLPKTTKVYISEKLQAESVDWFGQPVPATSYPAVEPELAGEYFECVDSPDKSEVAFIFIDSPSSPSYHSEYKPINLQYRPYTAVRARAESIAAPGDNRTYKGVTAVTDNELELDHLLKVRKAMGDKPVVVFITLSNPAVMSEFEPYVDAIVADFGVQRQAQMDLAAGKFEPSGLLPCRLPKDMETVEAHMEDTPFDMVPYTDETGNVYDFAFGLNWSQPIADERVHRYKNR